MKKRNLYIVAALVVAVVLLLGILEITGMGIVYEKPVRCIDSDGGLERYVQGTAKYENKDTAYTDECYTLTGKAVKWLKEYYCYADNWVKTERYYCDKGCKDGACLK